MLNIFYFIDYQYFYFFSTPPYYPIHPLFTFFQANNSVKNYYLDFITINTLHQIVYFLCTICTIPCTYTSTV